MNGMTRVTLLALKLDALPGDLHLDTVHGEIIRLAPGVHLDLTDTPEETCVALAQLLLKAAAMKQSDAKVVSLQEVA